MKTKKCYTCKHWEGDKIKAVRLANEYPEADHLYRGWQGSGPCNQQTNWATIDISGDAVAYLEVNANFSCPYWEE